MFIPSQLYCSRTYGTKILANVADIFPFFVLSQAIKDIHLLAIVAGLLAVDVVFLSCWIATDPLQAKTLIFKDMVRHLQSS